MSKQFAYRDSRTGKTLTVSRDVYYAMEHEQKKTKEKQDAIIAKAKKLLGKRYSGKTNEVEIAIKFDENGGVNDLLDPQWELSGALANLDPEMKKIIDNVILQVFLCTNQAQSQRQSDIQGEVKEITKEKAA